jgi:putative MATE family efflux protein
LERIPKYKEIWTIAYPIIIAMVAQNVINVTDTAFLGRLGEVELGASAIAGLFYISLYMLGFGFTTGTQILVARRYGEDRHSEIGTIVDHGFYFLLALAILLFLIIKFLAPAFMETFIASVDVRNASLEFLRYRIWGLFFAFINILIRAFYIGITDTKFLTINAVIMAVVNVILGYALIFGNLGFPKMGIAGAGLASVISEAIAAAFFLALTFRKKYINVYNIYRFPKPDLEIIGKTLSISVFIMAQFFISLGGWFVFFMFIEKMGERPLAISNIIRSAYMVLMLPVWALGSTASSLVSQAIGAGQHEFVIPIIRKISKLSLGIVSLVVLITAFIPHLIISVYTNNSGLVEDTVPSLYVILGVLILFSVAQVMFSGVSGTANTNVAMGMEITTIAIYLFFTWLIAVHLSQPIEVVWTSEYIYFVLLGVMSFFYLRYGNWRKKVI